MRHALALAFLLLAACGQRDQGAPKAQPITGADPAAPRPPDNAVECRPAGAAEFAPVCWLSIAGSPAGRVLTISKPDGGFRRLLVTRDGRGLVAADGAEPARVTILSDRRIEVAIGGDRFRLAAWVRR